MFGLSKKQFANLSYAAFFLLVAIGVVVGTVFLYRYLERRGIFGAYVHPKNHCVLNGKCRRVGFQDECVGVVI